MGVSETGHGKSPADGKDAAMKTAIDKIAPYNPSKYITNTGKLLQEWLDLDVKIYLYDLIDVKNHKESLPNVLEILCKLGISSAHEVICKPSGGIYLK